MPERGKVLLPTRKELKFLSSNPLSSAHFFCVIPSSTNLFFIASRIISIINAFRILYNFYNPLKKGAFSSSKQVIWTPRNQVFSFNKIFYQFFLIFYGSIEPKNRPVEIISIRIYIVLFNSFPSRRADIFQNLQ